MEKIDIAVIGAGAVGCATALKLTKYFPGRRIVIFEKNEKVGLGASGRNSGVLHSGFHHPVGSLKEKLANRGSKMTKEYAKARAIPLLECGMLIVIPRVSSFSDVFIDFNLLKTMYTNARKQYLKFSLLSKREVQRLEPNVKAVAGIFLPDIAVIDAPVYVESLYTESAVFAEYYFNTRVESVLTGSGTQSVKVFVINDRFQARAIINCAGVYADGLAEMAGVRANFQFAVRGEYYEIIGSQKNIVSRLVNPAVMPGSYSKGVHFGPRPDGRLFLGPSFKPVQDGNDYDRDHTEPGVFLNAVKEFVPDLRLENLKWSHSGIRSKLSLESDLDFVIKIGRTDPPMVVNFGIGSPGLSASMAIAEMNCDLLRWCFG